MIIYRAFADLVVVLHAAYVSFVVLGQAAIPLGLVFRWAWVRNFWFRLLREKGGQTGYAGDFIGHWVHELIFFDAPPWVFTACYLAFGLVVAATFFFAPPRWPRQHDHSPINS
jgi:hypothetical protein